MISYEVFDMSIERKALVKDNSKQPKGIINSDLLSSNGK